MPSHTPAEKAKRQAEKERRVGSFITKTPSLSPSPVGPTPSQQRRTEEKAAGIIRKPTEKQEKLKRFLKIFGIKF